jgi:hypothetical protein
MAMSIEDFLKTEKARYFGFETKCQFTTAAVRKLLTDAGFYEQKFGESINEEKTSKN